MSLKVSLWAKAISERMTLHTSSGTCGKRTLQTKFDPSIFMNQTGSIIIAAFVNDLGSVYSDETEEMEIFQHLETQFQITEEDSINWMVGINIQFSLENIRLSQTVYLEKYSNAVG